MMNAVSNCDWREDACIQAALAPFGFVPSSVHCSQIRVYVDLLLKWNKKLNLTTITSPSEILQRHFGESAFALPKIKSGMLMDIGSGAGFPGMALKLFNPDLDVTLVEPVLKKAAFLKEIARAITVNVAVDSRRIDRIDIPSDYLDTITVRGVRMDEALLSWASSALKTDGRLVAWLGAADAANLCQHEAFSWDTFSVPSSESRILLVGHRAA